MKLHKSLALFGACLLLLTACGSDEDTADESAEAEEPETEEVANVKEAAEDDVEEDTEETPEQTNDDVDDGQIAEINSTMAEYMEENRGFALGTLDENGDPTENGEPNPDFEWALYVHELTYDGQNLEMQTDAGFLELSDDERTFVANSAQNVGNVHVGMFEDWDNAKYQDRLFLTVLNGENSLGHSKAFNVTEFEWYD